MKDAKRNPPQRVLLVGEYGDDDQVKKLWEREADRHNYPCDVVSLADFAATPGEGVLALVNPGIGQAALMKKAISTQASKVLYFSLGGIALVASKVIEYCQQNRVCDAIVGDPAAPEVFKTRLERFRGRLGRVFAGAAPYDPILHRSE